MSDGIIQKVFKKIERKRLLRNPTNRYVPWLRHLLNEYEQELITEIRNNCKQHGIFIMTLEELIGDNKE